MKKILKIALVAILALSLVACSSSTGESSGSGVLTVGFVTDTGGIDDKSFNQTTWEGIVQFAEENGLVEGEDYDYLQSSGEDDYVPNLTALAEEGYDLVVAAGYLFESSITYVAEQYPDTKFVAIDVADVGLDNVQTANFAVNEGSYLVGVVAGLKAIENGSKHVGMIIGGESDSMNSFWAGFQEGVWSVCSDCVISYDNANSYTDSELGSTLAQKQFNAGATVIFACAGGTGNGVISEASERRQNGEDVWVIGVDTDQYDLGLYGDNDESSILTSMMKRVDVAAYTACEQVANDSFVSGDVLYNLENGGVGLPDENPNLTDEYLEAVEEAIQAITSGEVTVSSIPQTSADNSLIIG